MLVNELAESPRLECVTKAKAPITGFTVTISERFSNGSKGGRASFVSVRI